MRELTKEQQDAMNTDRWALLEGIEGKPLEGPSLLMVLNGVHRSGFIAGLECQEATPAPDAVDKLQRANYLLSGSANLLHADIDKGNEMIAALVEALRPFAACAELWDDDDAHRVLHYSRRNVPNQPDLKITVGDLQRAAAALALVGGVE